MLHHDARCGDSAVINRKMTRDRGASGARTAGKQLEGCRDLLTFPKLSGGWGRSTATYKKVVKFDFYY